MTQPKVDMLAPMPDARRPERLNMTIGTKSVLFGAHQFLLHPWFVAWGWWTLYGFPFDPRLWVAFFVHDLGYIGKPNMDGPEGELHPRFGARLMALLFDWTDRTFRFSDGGPIARLQERTANRRRNRNHHLSRRLIAENQFIAFSGDRHRAIAIRFGKSVSNAGHYQLRSMLAYKSRTGGREYIEVSNRNSTRRCSACGALTGPTGWQGLSVREWDCSACGAHHDRDVNAAVNTLITGRGARHESRCETASGTAL